MSKLSIYVILHCYSLIFLTYKLSKGLTEMYIMNECYRYYPVAIAFPRYSIFRNKFSDLIRSLQVIPAIRLFKIAKEDH